VAAVDVGSLANIGWWRSAGDGAGDVEVLNLAGAALLAVGLTDEIAMLRRPCVVVCVPDRVT